LRQWTRLQRVRTAAEIPLEVDLAAETVPVFQRIASKAAELRAQGLSDRAIGRELGVDPKTVAKAVAWFGTLKDRVDK
jgi:DNA-binding NarL/FixJ family response regulator